MNFLFDVETSSGKRITLHQIPRQPKLVLSLWMKSKKLEDDIVLSPTYVAMLAHALDTVAARCPPKKRLTTQQYSEISEQLDTVINLIDNVYDCLNE